MATDMAFGIALVAAICLGLLVLAGFFALALRREGSRVGRGVRLWTGVHIAQYVCLVVFIIASVSGVPRSVVLALAALWVSLIVAQWVIRRRTADWPTVSDKGSLLQTDMSVLAKDHPWLVYATYIVTGATGLALVWFVFGYGFALILAAMYLIVLTVMRWRR
jgi:hypothetical protein